MVAGAIYITDSSGRVLIHRNYRGTIPPTATLTFRKFLADVEDTQHVPVFEDDGLFYCFVQHNDLYLLAVTRSNSNAMLIMTYLRKIIEIFSDYFGELEQESIRDNFVLIYELLDEMCDFGYPQHTESKILQDYICISEKHRLELHKEPTTGKDISALLTGRQHFRKQGIKYRKNEVFLDVIEKLTLLVSARGEVLHSEIQGTLNLKTYLSGVPELKLGLNDKIMMERKKGRKSRSKCVEMDDLRFHDCVSLARFENERVISFIPPDGEFELMTYRLSTHVKPVIMVEAHREEMSHSRVEFAVKARSEYKRRTTANNVTILIPVPPDVSSPQFKCSTGHCEYAPEEDCMKWTIKQFSGQREVLMRAHFRLPSITSGDYSYENDYKRKPIRVYFEIPYFTVSGVQVRYLKIVEKSGYKSLPWVRYITQNGVYEIRAD